MYKTKQKTSFVQQLLHIWNWWLLQSTCICMIYFKFFNISYFHCMLLYELLYTSKSFLFWWRHEILLPPGDRFPFETFTWEFETQKLMRNGKVVFQVIVLTSFCCAHFFAAIKFTDIFSASIFQLETRDNMLPALKRIAHQCRGPCAVFRFFF